MVLGTAIPAPVAWPCPAVVEPRRRRDLLGLARWGRVVLREVSRHPAHQVVTIRRRLALPPGRRKGPGLEAERGLHGQAQRRALEVGAQHAREPWTILAQGLTGSRQVGGAAKTGDGIGQRSAASSIGTGSKAAAGIRRRSSPESKPWRSRYAAWASMIRGLRGGRDW